MTELMVRCNINVAARYHEIVNSIMDGRIACEPAKLHFRLRPKPDRHFAWGCFAIFVRAVYGGQCWTAPGTP